MAQATVKTVQYVDPRIEPQPDPVYDYVIGPTQNQYYKIPASGKSNSNLTFNNLTTLGVDRAYLDTFELELGITIKFELDATKAGDGGVIDMTGGTIDADDIIPRPDEWTFQSFPFNTCCDEARVNINGGAFFSQPMCYVRAKERYMNQWELSKCYENVCPIHKPLLQTESGRNYNTTYNANLASQYNNPCLITQDASTKVITRYNGIGAPTRLGVGMYNFMQSDQGMAGGFNNSIVRLGKYDSTAQYYDNMKRVTENGKSYLVVKVTWREPLFVSPFSSRYDATYGRPLYNITSLDFAFNLMDLGNMLRVTNLYANFNEANTTYVKDYTINIDTANLCYQVMTIPAILQKPLTTLVPYRRFVPYITEYNSQSGAGGSGTTIDVNGADKVEILSGVYTLNEIPTAIWVFCAPTKDTYQTNKPDTYTVSGSQDNVNRAPNWDTNKLFAYMTHINISLANTTQILNTAEPLDLYRIAKANGCEDSYWSWGIDDALMPKNAVASAGAKMYYGAGSVLRLKPGVDLIVPDVPLIPGANANNMVLQVRAQFNVPPHSANQNRYALWLLFEYVGVAAISPGQCEITMNPLGSGEIMAVSPVMSATSQATEGNLGAGNGFWDKTKQGASIAAQIADEGIISRILKHIPNAEAKAVGSYLEKHGFGEPGAKRPRGCSGGAVIGRGLNAWV